MYLVILAEQISILDVACAIRKTDEPLALVSSSFPFQLFLSKQRRLCCLQKQVCAVGSK